MHDEAEVYVSQLSAWLMRNFAEVDAQSRLSIISLLMRWQFCIVLAQDYVMAYAQNRGSGHRCFR